MTSFLTENRFWSRKASQNPPEGWRKSPFLHPNPGLHKPYHTLRIHSLFRLYSISVKIVLAICSASQIAPA
jgi:hypothetical protein